MPVSGWCLIQFILAIRFIYVFSNKLDQSGQTIHKCPFAWAKKATTHLGQVHCYHDIPGGCGHFMVMQNLFCACCIGDIPDSVAYSFKFIDNAEPNHEITTTLFGFGAFLAGGRARA